MREVYNSSLPQTIIANNYLVFVEAAKKKHSKLRLSYE